MKQHAKGSNLHKWYINIATDIWKWFRDFAKSKGKSQGLLITEILRDLKKRQDFDK